MKADAPASAYACKWQNTFKYEDMCVNMPLMIC
jgi:hypothetical protein